MNTTYKQNVLKASAHKASLLQQAYGSIFVILCLTALPATASPEDDAKAGLAKPYVIVNGVTQTYARAEILLREQLGRGVPDSKELRDGVREILINQSLMEQESLKSALDKAPLVQAQIELAQQNILAQAWQQKTLSEMMINDTDLKAEYDRQIELLGDKEYLVRHVLVKDEATAKRLIEKLQAGAKIAVLAKANSVDASTKDRGGLTDWTNLVNFMPAVADAVKKLEKGKFAKQPVHSDIGWHILQLDDVRAYKVPKQEVLKPQLTQIIAKRTLDARIKALRNSAKVQ
jgi:peptidyl-prolyl cis-trans isomerase C